MNLQRLHYSVINLSNMKVFSVILLLGLARGAERDWWERGNFYQIYPRSWKDSDGDGVGDLKGTN